MKNFRLIITEKNLVLINKIIQAKSMRGAKMIFNNIRPRDKDVSWSIKDLSYSNNLLLDKIEFNY
jgi:hypothetical protein